MLSHEMFQEQRMRDLERELETSASRARAGHRSDRRRTPAFVRTLIPAITHGLMGIPAPPRAAHGGC
jgi:hypothetical protein